MATPGKTNFRTYEAQSRLLAAVIATANPKLDFKAIAAHVGSDTTPSAIDHRLRALKQLAKMQTACVKDGEDPKDLPTDKGEIQKLFGESTVAGLEYHLRDHKKLGQRQKAAAAKGENTSKLNIASGGATPRSGVKARATPASGTSGGRKKASVAASPTPRGSASAKKRRASFGDSENDDEDEDGNTDCSAKDAEPAKKLKKEPVATNSRTNGRTNGHANGHGVNRTLFPREGNVVSGSTTPASLQPATPAAVQPTFTSASHYLITAPAAMDEEIVDLSGDVLDGTSVSFMGDTTSMFEHTKTLYPEASNEFFGENFDNFEEGEA